MFGVFFRRDLRGGEFPELLEELPELLEELDEDELLEVDEPDEALLKEWAKEATCMVGDALSAKVLFRGLRGDESLGASPGKGFEGDLLSGEGFFGDLFEDLSLGV